MWLLTPLGFFSIVCKPGDMKAGTLTVRARVKSDLLALRDHYLPSMGAIEEIARADYRFRARAQRSEVASALAKMAMEIDYSNFKDEVAKTQGYHRAEIYSDVWSTLYRLQKHAQD